MTSDQVFLDSCDRGMSRPSLLLRRHPLVTAARLRSPTGNVLESPLRAVAEHYPSSGFSINVPAVLGLPASLRLRLGRHFAQSSDGVRRRTYGRQLYVAYAAFLLDQDGRRSAKVQQADDVQQLHEAAADIEYRSEHRNRSPPGPGRTEGLGGERVRDR
jgi:hypothetical protein